MAVTNANSQNSNLEITFYYIEELLPSNTVSVKSQL